MAFLRRNSKPGLSTERIEYFSDGVFAIAITILVLAIAIPQLSSAQIAHGDMLRSLINLWPRFLSFFISFIVIGIFWVGHVIMFRFIKRSDRTFLWLNILLLLFVSFIPFPAALIGQYGVEKHVVILYGATLMILGFMYLLIWLYASHNHRLIDPELDKKLIRKGVLVVLIAPLTYLIAITLALINPQIAVIIYILIPVLYLIPSPIDEFVDYAFKEENG